MTLSLQNISFTAPLPGYPLLQSPHCSVKLKGHDTIVHGFFQKHIPRYGEAGARLFFVVCAGAYAQGSILDVEDCLESIEIVWK